MWPRLVGYERKLNNIVDETRRMLLQAIVGFFIAAIIHRLRSKSNSA